MRNIVQYPITIEEVMVALNDAQAALDSEAIGDLRPYILRRIKNVIEHMTKEEFERHFHA